MSESLQRLVYRGLVIMAIFLVATTSSYGETRSEQQSTLLELRELDQRRGEIRDIEAEFGYGSPEYLAAWEQQNAIDADNQQRLAALVAEWGWPRISQVGAEAADAAFLIVQHADLPTQQSYLPLIRQAAREGEAAASAYALLQDRILMREGKRTLYGTQLRRNELTGGWFLWPIEDEGEVDSRRAELGLGPLAEELARYPFEIEKVPADFELLPEA